MRQRWVRVALRVGWLGRIPLRGPVHAIQFFRFAIVGFKIVIGNGPGRRLTGFVADCLEVTLSHPVHRCAVEFCWTAHYADLRRQTPDVYAYGIPGPPRRQAKEITTLQDEYAKVMFRETMGQSAAPESGADHYRIVRLLLRRATDSSYLRKLFRIE